MNAFLILLSAATFILYGVLCLMTDHMKSEFKRYGFCKFRTFTGWLELMGGLGLIVGLQNRPILILSSAGLAVLMLMGTVIRIKVKDPLLQLIPAATLMFINAFIFYQSIKQGE